MGFQRHTRRERHAVRTRQVNAAFSPPPPGSSLLIRFLTWLGVGA